MRFFKIFPKPIIPKEHGAWGMLYVPFFSSFLLLKYIKIEYILFFFLISLLFLSKEPLIAIMRLEKLKNIKSKNFYDAIYFLVFYFLLISFLSFLLIFIYGLKLLIYFGIVAFFLLIVYIYFVSKKKERTFMGEIFAITGLSLSAPAGYYSLTSSIDLKAIILWIINGIFFISSIFYVKLRVSFFIRNEEKIRKSKTLCLIYHLFLFLFIVSLIVSNKISYFVFFAFLPVIVRGIWPLIFEPSGFNIKKIGRTELIYSLIFVIFIGFVKIS
ncbi:MAG: YwiC-like family protein [Acidobacteriota bacterium]